MFYVSLVCDILVIDGGKAQWNDQQEFEVEEIIDYVKEEVNTLEDIV